MTIDADRPRPRGASARQRRSGTVPGHAASRSRRREIASRRPGTCTDPRRGSHAAATASHRSGRGTDPLLEPSRVVLATRNVRHDAKRSRRRSGTTAAVVAPQSRAALSARSRPTPAGRRSASCEMTRRISAVAVCCSSASVSSRFRASSSVEQPHVLDRDHRLVGEGLEQRDLLVGERPRPRPGDHVIAPIGSSFAQHRHRQQRFGSRSATARALRRVLRVQRATSGDVDDRAVEDRADRMRLRSGGDRIRAPRSSTSLGVEPWWPTSRMSVAVEAEDRRESGLAEASGAHGDGVEYRLGVGRRAAR